MSKIILLTGPPGCGKTTLIRRIVDAIQMPAGGFYTREIREQGVRKGFEIITLDGQRGTLAHVGIRSTKKISKYGVDLAALDSLAVAAIEEAVAEQRLVVIDEIGPMEILSDRFCHAVIQALESPSFVLGAIAKRSMPFTDRVKSMPGVKVIEVLRGEWDRLLSDVLDMLGEQ
jgi:nucleoside-triphosphatase